MTNKAILKPAAVLFFCMCLALVLLVSCSRTNTYAPDSAAWVLEKHIKALGGRKALKAIQSYEIIDTDVTSSDGKPNRTTINRIYVSLDGRYYISTHMETKNGLRLLRARAFDGGSGWDIGFGQKRPQDLTDAHKQQIESEIDGMLNFPLNYASLVSSGLLVRLPNREREGQEYYVLKRGESDQAMEIYVNSNTSLVDLIISGGNGLILEQAFLDYAPINGVQFANTLRTKLLSEDTNAIVSTGLSQNRQHSINQSFTPSDFSPPS